MTFIIDCGRVELSIAASLEDCLSPRRSEKEQDLPRLPTILASGPAFQPCLNICDLLAMMNISSISRGAIRSSRRLLWTVLVFIS